MAKPAEGTDPVNSPMDRIVLLRRADTLHDDAMIPPGGDFDKAHDVGAHYRLAGGPYSAAVLEAAI